GFEGGHKGSSVLPNVASARGRHIVRHLDAHPAVVPRLARPTSPRGSPADSGPADTEGGRGLVVGRRLSRRHSHGHYCPHVAPTLRQRCPNAARARALAKIS